MSGETIPEDIRAAAIRIATDDFGIDIPGRVQNSYIGAIADALLAERERCAAIANAEYERRLENRAGYPAARVHDFIVVAVAIENGIRQTPPAPTKANRRTGKE